MKPPLGYVDPFFGSRGGEPEDETLEDISSLKAHCESLYDDFGCGKVEVGSHRIWKVLSHIHPILSRNAATPNPSLFKRASAFTIAFMEHPPLDIPFTGGKLPDSITRIPKHQNAVAAFEFCRKSLVTAEIYKKIPGGKKGESKTQTAVLSEPIRLSKHFYCDTIHAISIVDCDASFHLLSLLYESLSYKANPKASYPAGV